MTDRKSAVKAARRTTRSIPGMACTFDGTFTPEIRTLMRDKRRALGASLQQLAEMMGVNISTLRKWESGQGKRCHAIHICRIVEFLGGEYDRRLKAVNIEARGFMHIWTSLPEHVSGRLERALTIYRICSGHPDLQQDLMDGFDNAMGGALQRLMTRSWPAGTHGLGAGLRDTQPPPGGLPAVMRSNADR